MAEQNRPLADASRQAQARAPTLKVEVVYALRDRQALIEVELEEGSTVRGAIARSGIQERFPGMRIAAGSVGIFGRRVELDVVVRDGDRVEIYRPLAADPKQARRERAGRRAAR